MTVIEYLLLGIVIFISCFQMFYLVESLRVKIAPTMVKPALRNVAPDREKQVSIVIPVYRADSTICACLESILGNSLALVDKVVVVLDRCPDSSKQRICEFIPKFAAQSTTLEVFDLPSKMSGKVQALLYGGHQVATESVLLLDADIILESTAIEVLLQFHLENHHSFSSGLIYPYVAEGESHSTTQQIICTNRLYRQSILQLVKNLHGVANFPGGLQMVNFTAYRQLLVDGFLEDLTATYQVLAAGGTIAILPQVLAYEVERETLLGLFLQRVRWTIGAIQHLPNQLAAARVRAGIAEKILIFSYHLMWEFQHYTIVFGLACIPFYPQLSLALCTPLLLYSITILRMQFLTQSDYHNSCFAALLHCLIHPCIITAALPGSILYLLRKRSFMFETTTLFQRI